ncbi:MAG: hypothetical protein ACTSQ6_10605, partial [Candidatus Heimdallarchaeaceae archaeon]
NTINYPAKEIKKLELPEKPKEEVSGWETWEKEIIKKASTKLAREHNVFGYSNLIPRLDPDITEGYLLEKYPKVRNLSPKRRLELAKEVFALAKYKSWKELDKKEPVLETLWEQDYEEYAEIIISRLNEAGEETCPKAAILNAMIQDLDKERYNVVRRSNHAGKNYHKLIRERIAAYFHAREKKEVVKRQDSSKKPTTDVVHNLKLALGDYRPEYRICIEDWFNYNIYKLSQEKIAFNRGLKSHSSVSKNIKMFNEFVKPDIERSRTGLGLAWETAVFHTLIKIAKEEFPDYYSYIRRTGGNLKEEIIYEDLEDFLPIRQTNTPGWEEETWEFVVYGQPKKEGEKGVSGHPLLSFRWLGGASRLDFELSFSCSSSSSLFNTYSFECKNALFSNKHSYSFDKLQPLLKDSNDPSRKFILSFSPAYLDRLSNLQKNKNNRSVSIKRTDKGLEEWVRDKIRELKEEKKLVVEVENK